MSYNIVESENGKREQQSATVLENNKETHNRWEKAEERRFRNGGDVCDNERMKNQGN